MKTTVSSQFSGGVAFKLSHLRIVVFFTVLLLGLAFCSSVAYADEDESTAGTLPTTPGTSNTDPGNSLGKDEGTLGTKPGEGVLVPPSPVEPETEAESAAEEEAPWSPTLDRVWLAAHPDAPIVILGARLNPDGSMPQVLINRLQEGLNWAKTVNNQIFVTGGPTQEGVETEGAAMRDWLIANGVSAERIVVDETALTTVDNANAFVRNFPDVYGAAIVTDPTHMDRAIVTFNDAAPDKNFIALYSMA